MGKVNSPVMSFRGTCDDYLFGPTRNPFDPSRNSGGSSGGSAAAVADGMLPIAEGTDGGGFIRIPASWCGAYGYKQSFGRSYTGRPNAFGSVFPFVFEGTITSTVEDAALGLNALSGHDPRRPRRERRLREAQALGSHLRAPPKRTRWPRSGHFGQRNLPENTGNPNCSRDPVITAKAPENQERGRGRSTWGNEVRKGQQRRHRAGATGGTRPRRR